MEPTNLQKNETASPNSETIVQNTDPTPQNTMLSATPPISTPTPLQAEEKPKNQKRSIIILSVIAGIFLIATGIFAFLYFSNNSGGEEPQEESSEDTQEIVADETEEIEITDQLLKNDLDEKIAILHDTPQTSATINKGTVVGGYSNSLFELYLTGNISQPPLRVSRVINALQPQFRYLNAEEREAIVNSVPQEYQEEVRNQALQGIDGSIVSKKYKEVFGEEASKEELNNCYAYKYNSTYDIYYKDPIGGCGGTSPFKTYHYKNKYTTDGDKAYIYVFTALSDGENNNVYCDIAYLDITGTFELTDDAKVCDTVSTGGKDFTLNDSNYQNFAQYRFVFNEADDGTYYFSKVEKLSS